MTLRLYIDEVGNADLASASTDPNVRYLALTGVYTTREWHDRIISSALDRAKAFLPPPSTGGPLVLHRREILRREGPFASLRDPDIGSRFDATILELLRSAPYLAITVQIDKKAHWETYGAWHFDPYHYCLRCLIERYVLYLRRHEKRGDVAIEPRFKKADKKLKASFQRIYETGTENIPGRVVQAHLISKDIQFFAKKSNVAGLQIADLLAHPSARHMRFAKNGEAMPNDFGAQIAQILVDRRYARNPQTHQIDGWGTKWLP